MEEGVEFQIANFKYQIVCGAGVPVESGPGIEGINQDKCNS